MSTNEKDFAPFQVILQISSDTNELEAVRGSLFQQLRKVSDSGVTAAILNFFQSVPIVVVCNTMAAAEGGCYIQARREIWLDAPTLVRDDAVRRVYALHELLHAYHHQILDGGFNNPDVMQFYADAKDGRYEPFVPPCDYMFKNCMEFYAITASAFLHGKIPRPPGTRENIKRCHPQYYAWLQKTLLNSQPELRSE